MAQIRSKPFGVTKEGANVTEYILSNPGGMSVSVLDYGCVIKNIIVPAKNGPVDVVLGHDTMADYENDFTSSGSTCCGAFVGRYANRIENAVFTLGGKTYQLEKNNGENHLHGCFSRKIYEVKYFGDTLLMEAVSPDGEDGFPGTLKIAVRYTLTDDNTFRMDYRVSSDADTIVNLTNYSVIYKGHSIEMPPKELELLYFLASSPNQVFTREQLLDHIWGYEYIGDTRTVDVHIKRLREKIKDHASWAITTVWGIGYKFEVKR